MTAREDETIGDRGAALNRREGAGQDTGTSPRWRPPWRVEGERPDSESDRWAASWQRPGGSRFWLVLAGLLVLNWLGADPVRKISIIPRGMALGVTLQSPDTDRYGYSRRYLRGRIVGALGGRAAEELVYGDITTGAENDLEQATKIARQMVGRWGMSEAVGPVSVLPDPRTEQPVALDGSGPAPATRELVDAEVRRILDDCYAQARDILAEHRDRLERLARALLAAETLDTDEAYEAAGFPSVPPRRPCCALPGHPRARRRTPASPAIRYRSVSASRSGRGAAHADPPGSIQIRPAPVSELDRHSRNVPPGPADVTRQTGAGPGCGVGFPAEAVSRSPWLSVR